MVLSRRLGAWDITNILIESLCSGSGFIGDPGVTHGAFRVVLSVLQLLQVVVDPLWSADFPITTLEPVQGDGDILGLATPIPLGMDGPKCAGQLLDHSPGS